MEEDVRGFLRKFAAEELVEPHIWEPDSRYSYQLRARSVAPLIVLMKEHKVKRLEATERNWFLTADGEFGNPSSGESRSGKVEDLANPGNIFNLQNRHINPFFTTASAPDSLAVESETQPVTQAVDSGEIKFGLERDLQRALCENVGQLDPRLKIIDGSSEQHVEAGWIDITAEDDAGNLVVIELKAGTAQPESVAQLLSYMGTIDDDHGGDSRHPGSQRFQSSRGVCCASHSECFPKSVLVPISI